ncbi:MAG: adenine phosphoribosyltransferase [Rhodothermales bacterium]
MTFKKELAAAIRTVPDFPEPGVQFKDITPILGDRDLLRKAVAALAQPYEDSGVTKVIAIEARGFILGSLLAHHLGAGFVPIRKRGKLPFQTAEESYQLEYGTDIIQMHIDAVMKDDVVLIHDDVIATGGTASAAYRLARRFEADVAGYSFLIELGFLGGRQKLEANLPVHVVLPM